MHSSSPNPIVDLQFTIETHLQTILSDTVSHADISAFLSRIHLKANAIPDFNNLSYIHSYLNAPAQAENNDEHLSEFIDDLAYLYKLEKQTGIDFTIFYPAIIFQYIKNPTPQDLYEQICQFDNNLLPLVAEKIRAIATTLQYAHPQIIADQVNKIYEYVSALQQMQMEGLLTVDTSTSHLTDESLKNFKLVTDNYMNAHNIHSALLVLHDAHLLSTEDGDFYRHAITQVPQSLNTAATQQLAYSFKHMNEVGLLSGENGTANKNAILQCFIRGCFLDSHAFLELIEDETITSENAQYFLDGFLQHPNDAAHPEHQRNLVNALQLARQSNLFTSDAQGIAIRNAILSAENPELLPTAFINLRRHNLLTESKYEFCISCVKSSSQDPNLTVTLLARLNRNGFLLNETIRDEFKKTMPSLSNKDEFLTHFVILKMHGLLENSVYGHRNMLTLLQNPTKVADVAGLIFVFHRRGMLDAANPRSESNRKLLCDDNVMHLAQAVLILKNKGLFAPANAQINLSKLSKILIRSPNERARTYFMDQLNQMTDLTQRSLDKLYHDAKAIIFSDMHKTLTLAAQSARSPTPSILSKIPDDVKILVGSFLTSVQSSKKNEVEQQGVFFNQQQNAINHLVSKFAIARAEAQAELKKLNETQIQLLMELYQDGLRGDHLRDWQKASGKLVFSDEHADALKAMMKQGVEIEKAVDALKGKTSVEVVCLLPLKKSNNPKNS